MESKFFLPLKMREIPNWVFWKKELSKGRETKIPYYLKRGASASDYTIHHASSTNPDTWSDFESVFGFQALYRGYFSGIGFVLTLESGLVFIDIDDCLSDDGILDDRAKDIVSTLQNTAFCEISQSGHGLHLFVQGTIPRAFKNPLNGVEMYAEKRYCAITGNSLLANEPQQDQASLDLLFEKYKTPDRPKDEPQGQLLPDHTINVSDARLLDLAKRNPRFLKLWEGDISDYSSHSEADLSLCGLLAFWCDRDIGRMDALFRMSGLCRKKWIEREDYRNNTLDLASAKCYESISQYIKRKNREEAEELEKCFLSE